MGLFTSIANSLRKNIEIKLYNKFVKVVNDASLSNSSLELIENLNEAFSDAIKEERMGDAIAIADEALFRASGKRFFETQKVAALLLSEGMLVEMATGEGKTLAFSLAAALICKKSDRVTISTANDFLSNRDWKETLDFFNQLSIETSTINGKSSAVERREAYKKEVVYSTLREVSYDYLRDGFCQTKNELFNSTDGFLLVDEADNVLVDNASSPYQLSEEIDADERLICAAHDFAVQSAVGDDRLENFTKTDEGMIVLSEKGMEAVESFLTKHSFIDENSGLYDPENLYISALFEKAGYAIHEMKEGIDYVISEEKVFAIDKNSGRRLEGVSLSGGLQQIIEHKYKLPISKESFVSASIVTESVVSLYDNFAGMSGTLRDEEDELISVYGKGCITIPRKDKLARKDMGDMMFLSATEKTRYTLERIIEAYKKGQPVLVATTSEQEAQGLYKALNELNVQSQLVISKTPIEEASMIALSGMPRKVTITTGACGRGTDIVLGGNIQHFIEHNLIPSDEVEAAKRQQQIAKEDVLESGGLLVLGYGRQSTQKLDSQLRGRAGRQGDVGETLFVLSLEDTILGEHGKKLRGILSAMNVNEKDMLSHNMITKAFDSAQNTTREQILKSRKFHGTQASSLEPQRLFVYSLRKLIVEDDEWKDRLGSEVGIECKEHMTRDKALAIFDDEHRAYQDILTDLRRSINYQSYANKNPTQELKNKAFEEYKRFLVALKGRLEK